MFFLVQEQQNPITALGYRMWIIRSGECHQDIDVQKMSHETKKSQERSKQTLLNFLSFMMQNMSFSMFQHVSVCDYGRKIKARKLMISLGLIISGGD
jgi:hypothetical protein